MQVFGRGQTGEHSYLEENTTDPEWQNFESENNPFHVTLCPNKILVADFLFGATIVDEIFNIYKFSCYPLVKKVDQFGLFIQTRDVLCLKD